MIEPMDVAKALAAMTTRSQAGETTPDDAIDPAKALVPAVQRVNELRVQRGATRFGRKFSRTHNSEAACRLDPNVSRRPSGQRRGAVTEPEIPVVSGAPPISGTRHSQVFTIASPDSDRYPWRAMKGGYDETTIDTKNDKLRATAAVTV